MKMIDQYPDVEQEIRAALKWPMRLCLAIGLVCLLGAACLALQGCSTRTLTIHPDGTVNASQTALGYCPEAVLIRVEDGRVEMLSEASGVGATVQALGRDAVEVMR